jgi:hypothetical protein
VISAHCSAVISTVAEPVRALPNNRSSSCMAILGVVVGCEPHRRFQARGPVTLMSI